MGLGVRAEDTEATPGCTETAGAWELSTTGDSEREGSCISFCGGDAGYVVALPVGLFSGCDAIVTRCGDNGILATDDAGTVVSAACAQDCKRVFGGEPSNWPQGADVEDTHVEIDSEGHLDALLGFRVGPANGLCHTGLCPCTIPNLDPPALQDAHREVPLLVDRTSFPTMSSATIAAAAAAAGPTTGVVPGAAETLFGLCESDGLGPNAKLLSGGCGGVIVAVVYEELRDLAMLGTGAEVDPLVTGLNMESCNFSSC